MSAEEREIWDEKARKDRTRYEAEVMSYKGPWKVLAKREKKPHDAPKRPMSAFLSFSNKRRSGVMKKNPSLNQAEISSLLSKMWNEASPELREEHIKKEHQARLLYKKDIAAWRERDKELKLKERSDREAQAMERAESTASANVVASACRTKQLLHFESDSIISLQRDVVPPHLGQYTLPSFSEVQQQSPAPSLSRMTYHWARPQENLEQPSTLLPRMPPHQYQLEQQQQHETLQQNMALANMRYGMWLQRQPSVSSLNTHVGFQQPQMGGNSHDHSSRTDIQHQLLQMGTDFGGMQHQIEDQQYQTGLHSLTDRCLDPIVMPSHQHQQGAGVDDIQPGFASISNSPWYADGDDRALDWADFLHTE